MKFRFACYAFLLIFGMGAFPVWAQTDGQPCVDKPLIDYVGSQPAYYCAGDSNFIGKALASEEGWESYPYADFWSSTNKGQLAVYHRLLNYMPYAFMYDAETFSAFSVRCIKTEK